MQLVQLHLGQSLPVEDQVSWDRQYIFDESCGAEAGQRPIGEHPMGSPGQGIVGHICQQHKRLLGGGSSLASLAELQSALVCLDFRLASAPVIVVLDHLCH